MASRDVSTTKTNSERDRRDVTLERDRRDVTLERDRRDVSKTKTPSLQDKESTSHTNRAHFLSNLKAPGAKMINLNVSIVER